MDIRIVDGRLTRDAEIKKNPKNGLTFISFTLANNQYVNEQEVTTYFNVVSYNDFYCKHPEKYLKGKHVIVNGLPSENITVKNGKTYLNRNIIAYNINPGISTVIKETNNQINTYHDVAPATPTCEVPEVKSRPLNVNIPSQTEHFEVDNSSNSFDDELPF